MSPVNGSYQYLLINLPPLPTYQASVEMTSTMVPPSASETTPTFATNNVPKEGEGINT